MVPKVSNTFQDLASRSFFKSPSNIRNTYFIRPLNRQKNTFNCVNDKIIEYGWLLIGTVFDAVRVRGSPLTSKIVWR